ncbi:DUF883 family protein [Devosia sp.]|uniref:DUF883 family protein n=1 Tax=Devosia sp. TaxID=1871048 RepID=UPI003A8DBAB1
MAATTDMAPSRSTKSSAAGARRSSSRTKEVSREDELSAQIEQLQNDLKSIAGTLAGLAEDKVQDAKSIATRETDNLKKQGQNTLDDVQDEFGQIEKQLKDTIREKPLTAVAGAVALGFVLAVVSR